MFSRAMNRSVNRSVSSIENPFSGRVEFLVTEDSRMASRDMIQITQIVGFTYCLIHNISEMKMSSTRRSR